MAQQLAEYLETEFTSQALQAGVQCPIASMSFPSDAYRPALIDVDGNGLSIVTDFWKATLASPIDLSAHTPATSTPVAPSDEVRLVEGDGTSEGTYSTVRIENPYVAPHSEATSVASKTFMVGGNLVHARAFNHVLTVSDLATNDVLFSASDPVTKDRHDWIMSIHVNDDASLIYTMSTHDYFSVFDLTGKVVGRFRISGSARSDRASHTDSVSFYGKHMYIGKGPTLSRIEWTPNTDFDPTCDYSHPLFMPTVDLDESFQFTFPDGDDPARYACANVINIQFETGLDAKIPNWGLCTHKNQVVIWDADTGDVLCAHQFTTTSPRITIPKKNEYGAYIMDTDGGADRPAPTLTTPSGLVSFFVDTDNCVSSDEIGTLCLIKVPKRSYGITYCEYKIVVQSELADVSALKSFDVLVKDMRPTHYSDYDYDDYYGDYGHHSGGAAAADPEPEPKGPEILLTLGSRCKIVCAWQQKTFMDGYLTLSGVKVIDRQLPVPESSGKTVTAAPYIVAVFQRSAYSSYCGGKTIVKIFNGVPFSHYDHYTSEQARAAHREALAEQRDRDITTYLEDGECETLARKEEERIQLEIEKEERIRLEKQAAEELELEKTAKHQELVDDPAAFFDKYSAKVTDE